MAERKRRTESPEVRRAQLLEAAKTCFREKGFHPTRMAEIAEQAGISVGLVYRYFPSKQAVVEAIVRDDLDAQRRFFEELFAAYPDDPVAALEHGAAGYVHHVTDRDRTALMLEVASEVIRNPAMRACDAETREQLYEMFRSRLRGKGKKGMSDTEIEARVQLLGALITGLAIQLAVQNREADPILFEIMEETAKRIVWPHKD